MSEIRWVKLSTQMFDDEKIKAIRSMPSGNDICLIWIQLISIAGRVNDHGQIYISEDVPYTETTLANSMGHPVGTVRLAIQTFKKMGMLDILSNDIIALVNWEKHQSIDRLEVIKERDRLRKKKVRSYLKQLSMSPDSPRTSPAKVLESPSTELDSELELDKEKIATPKRTKKTEVAPDVFMTDSEKSKLVERFGESVVVAKISELSCALGNRIPKDKYKDHYKTVINWIERDSVKDKPKRGVVHKFCKACGKEYFGSACQCGWSE